MHFLCLHGVGTNSQVLETSTATIRYEMDSHHTFEFVEGSQPCPINEDIKAYYPSTDTYYQYYNYQSAPSISHAIDQLDTYIAEEGPFDGIIGFSQGGSLAATYLIQFSQDHPSSPLPVQCAIFFSSGCFDPQALKVGKLRWMDVGQTVLRLPTAHIWDRNDTMWPESREALCAISQDSLRQVHIHDEGHNVPGARAKEAVQGSVRAIRRTIDQASLLQ